MTKSNNHWSIKDFLGGIIGGMLLSLVGLWMLVLPGARDDQPAKDSMRLIGKLLDTIWSIPGGIILVLLGVTIVVMTVYQLVTQYSK